MKIKERLLCLCEIGPRAPGSLDELKAAEYIRDTFRKSGIDAQIEAFESPSHLALRSTLKTLESGIAFTSLPTQFSPSGKITGKLVYIGTFDNPISNDTDFSGKIGLLIPSGGGIKERIDSILGWEKRGLAGLIVICSTIDSINARIIHYPEIKKLPSVGVSWRTGSELKVLEGQKVSLEVEPEKMMRNESQNVVVRVQGESKSWLVVSAHYDTAAFCQGGTEGGIGTAIVMELAERFADKKPPATIYFLFTGSKEYSGLDMTGAGSKVFYKKHSHEIENCIAHIDIDDIGNHLNDFRLYAAGPKAFKDALQSIPSPYKYRLLDETTPCSDHGGAVMLGIPYVWLTDFFEGRPFSHAFADKLECVDLQRIAEYTGYINDIILKFASVRPYYPYVRDGERLIRPVRFDDIPEILEITKQAFGPVSTDRMRQDFFGEKLGGKEWHEYKNREVESSLKSNIYAAVACEVNGRIVGYATFFYDAERGIANVGNNAVYPEYQGRGIGKAMQAEIKRRMLEDGYSKFAVNTLSNDIAAQKIYEKHGYKKYIANFFYLNKLQ